MSVASTMRKVEPAVEIGEYPDESDNSESVPALSALGLAPTSESTAPTPPTIHLDQIDDCPDYFRHDSDNDLVPLVQSLHEYGQRKPVVVRRMPNGRFETTSGTRVIRALRLAQARGMDRLSDAVTVGATLAHITIIEGDDVSAARDRVLENETSRHWSAYEECQNIVVWWDKANKVAKRELSSREFELKSGITHTRLNRARRVATYLCDESFVEAGLTNPDGTVDWARVNRIGIEALVKASAELFPKLRSQILREGVMPEKGEFGVTRASGAGKAANGNRDAFTVGGDEPDDEGARSDISDAGDSTLDASDHELVEAFYALSEAPASRPEGEGKSPSGRTFGRNITGSGAPALAETPEEAAEIRSAAVAGARAGDGLRVRFNAALDAIPGKRARAIRAVAEAAVLVLTPTIPAESGFELIADQRTLMIIGDIETLRASGLQNLTEQLLRALEQQ